MLRSCHPAFGPYGQYSWVRLRTSWRATLIRPPTTSGAPRCISSGGSCSWTGCRCVAGMWSSTSVAAPGRVSSCCSARSAPPGRSSASTRRRRCWPSRPVAARRVTEHGWRNVELLVAPAQDATITGRRRAVLRRARRVAVLCRAAHRADGPAAGRLGRRRRGTKWPGPWLAPLSAVVAAVHAPFVRDFTGFDCPWRHLAEVVDDLRVTEIAFGAGYLALGRVPAY